MLTTIILENNGATINKKGQCVQLKSGYQLSVRDCLKIPVKKFNDAVVNKILQCGLVRGQYAGFWVENGYVYGDISVRVATKKVAVAKGKELNQIAVWDWRKSQNVYCKA
jgi:hypothetical protein